MQTTSIVPAFMPVGITQRHGMDDWSWRIFMEGWELIHVRGGDDDAA